MIIFKGKRLPRIRGGEIEYAFVIWQDGKVKVGFLGDLGRQAQFCGFLPPSLRMMRPSIGEGYLSNGARLYLDIGFHPEYATPESLWAKHALIYEKAGDRIMKYIAERANQEWGGEKIFVQVFKNNVAPKEPEDTEGEKEKSYGCHESYLTLKYTSAHNLVVPLGLFFATRQLFTGNGKFYEHKGKIRFRISQRAPYFGFNLGGNTTTSRALINTREESHAGSDLRRQHIIVSDSNLAEPAIFLKFATTALLLDMIERGWGDRLPTLGKDFSYFSLLQAFSHDGSLTATQNVNGKPRTMPDIQEMYCQKAEEFCEVDGMNPERELALTLWRKVIELSRMTRPHEGLCHYTDWAAKKYIAELDLEKRGRTLQDNPNTSVFRSRNQKTRDISLIQHLDNLDWQYHELSEKGIFNKLSQQGFFERIVSDEDIEKAIFAPIPETTRACSRAEEIKYILAHENDGLKPELLDFVNWATPVMNWDYPKDQRNPYLDPYDWQPKHPLLKNNQF